MQSHKLKRNTKNKKTKQVGRGGTRGKTSGHGHKGQKARAGAKIRPALRDVIKRIPKLRGESASGSLRSDRSAKKPLVFNLSLIEEIFESGDDVNPKALVEKGALKKQGGKIPSVKILGNGEITKKVEVSGCTISDSATKKIEKAGGSVKN